MPGIDIFHQRIHLLDSDLWSRGDNLINSWQFLKGWSLTSRCSQCSGWSYSNMGKYLSHRGLPLVPSCSKMFYPVTLWKHQHAHNLSTQCCVKWDNNTENGNPKLKGALVNALPQKLIKDASRLWLKTTHFSVKQKKMNYLLPPRVSLFAETNCDSDGQAKGCAEAELVFLYVKLSYSDEWFHSVCCVDIG